MYTLYMSAERPFIPYGATGVDYSVLDRVKREAQIQAKETAENLTRFGMQEIAASRGESAYVWEEADSYRAFVIEGLGTKNRVADKTRNITGKTYYDNLAQDTVAMIVNDLIVVGADPQVVNAYFAVGSSDWFSDEQRSLDLVRGWKQACDKAGATWGGGETPTLKRIIEPDTIDLAGSAIGIIKPKERLTLGEKLTPGDAIVLVESSGVHANGLTLARAIADELPQGYATQLADSSLYGDALLTPTHIYANLVRNLFEQGIDIHYMVNITGHGWRKLMRAEKELSYVIDQVPLPHSVFDFIQEQSGNTDEEMYGNFNMGAGFALFVPEAQATLITQLAKQQHNLDAWHVGMVKEGAKQVIINPKNITFARHTLEVR